jgi:hypothetical protein
MPYMPHLLASNRLDFADAVRYTYSERAVIEDVIMPSPRATLILSPTRAAPPRSRSLAALTNLTVAVNQR